MFRAAVTSLYRITTTAFYVLVRQSDTVFLRLSLEHIVGLTYVDSSAMDTIICAKRDYGRA